MDDGRNLTKILIVDDKSANLIALKSLVESDDIDVLCAESGDRALSLLLDHDVALALIDVEMPGIDGIELARIMRSVSRTMTIPIILVSARPWNRQTVFEGYESGAIAFLTKPLDVHLVRNKVRVFVELDQKTKALKDKLSENEALRNEAEKANKAKSMFLANMSHEIRTPLGAIQGFVELLKSWNGSSEEKDLCIDAIERNAKLLLNLIDDVLDFAKIEAGKIETEIQRISLLELVQDLQSTYNLKTENKGIQFRINLNGKLPAYIHTDYIRIRQCLNNLIGNAVKFTSEGFVECGVEFVSNPEGTSKLKFRIQDSGCGMTEEETKGMFMPFSQANSATTRIYGGTGLGLVISRRLAKLLGGDIHLVWSQSGKGSIFEFIVDVGEIKISSLVEAEKLLLQKKTETSEKIIDSLKGKSILVVDDAVDNREFLKRIFTHSGAEVDVAENGIDALERASAHKFDAIVLDMQMPQMDGFTAAGLLCEKGYKNKIIGLTASATQDQIRRAIDSGCHKCLSKPIKSNVLISEVYAVT